VNPTVNPTVNLWLDLCEGTADTPTEPR